MPFTLWATSISLATQQPQVDEPTGVFGALADAAEWFIGLFQAGGEVFMGLVTGIIPTLIVLLTAVNALIRMIGPERIEKLGAYAARPGIQWYPVALPGVPGPVGLLPDQPDGYTMGRFLPERYKPAFYDSAVSFVHPITGIFPHANAGELLRLPRHRRRHHHARPQHRRPGGPLPPGRPGRDPHARHRHRTHHRRGCMSRRTTNGPGGAGMSTTTSKSTPAAPAA